MLKEVLLILSICGLSCKNETKRISDSHLDSLSDESYSPILRTYLVDTNLVKADCVVFLRPDSIRFESYKEDEGIYEADSDFGFWLTDAIDSLKNDKRLRGVVPYVTMDRFIKIKDCIVCPEIIDRDTIDYGVILISKKKGLKVNSGLGAGNYIHIIRDYFK